MGTASTPRFHGRLGGLTYSANDGQTGKRSVGARFRGRNLAQKDDRSLSPGSRRTHALVKRSLVLGLSLSSLALAGTGSLPAAWAAAAEPPIVAFDRFVSESNPVCQLRRATDCVDLAWRFADADADQGLSLDELEALRADLEVWAIWRQADLAAHERSGIALGLWLVDSVGLENVHAAYDADGDGLISRTELLADVHLDERPIGTVLLDPAAVDHAGIARRLGLPPTILERLPLEPPD
jgi:hypothetical protein